VLAIGKRVRGVIVERVPLRLRVLLEVGVLIGGEVLVGGGGIVARAGITRERSYADISNIRIINIRILYPLSRRFS
jgi:hypothetical protein